MSHFYRAVLPNQRDNKISARSKSAPEPPEAKDPDVPKLLYATPATMRGKHWLVLLCCRTYAFLEVGQNVREPAAVAGRRYGRDAAWHRVHHSAVDKRQRGRLGHEQASWAHAGNTSAHCPARCHHPTRSLRPGAFRPGSQRPMGLPNLCTACMSRSHP
jgi:hypothetical protein